MKNELKSTLEKVADNLRKNNMEAFIAEDKAQAKEIVQSLLKDGMSVAAGGSESLKECGVYDLLTSGRYSFIDRSKGKTPEEVHKLYEEQYGCDTYFCSSNAVTEDGVLYNVDGNSNRVSMIAFGPRSVVMVVGYNKIVKDLDEAILRVKTIAAPKNTVRLNIDTYCSKCGECVSISQGKGTVMSCGCDSDARICCNYLISSKQRHKGRIKVVLVGKKLGY